MTMEDLQNKIVKIAQAYRGERLRNEEFQKALKSANMDLAQAKTIQAEHDNLQMAFKEQSGKLSILSKENKKTTLYKDTVKKQEAVIGKLENLLEKLMRDKKARDASKKAITNSQAENDARFMSSEEEKLRIQIAKQEETINELRDELANVKGAQPDGNLETVELEVQLQTADARAAAAQQQLEQQALMHAREISNLKQQVLQKESIIDTLQGSRGGNQYLYPLGQQ